MSWGGSVQKCCHFWLGWVSQNKYNICWNRIGYPIAATYHGPFAADILACLLLLNSKHNLDQHWIFKHSWKMHIVNRIHKSLSHYLYVISQFIAHYSFYLGDFMCKESLNMQFFWRDSGFLKHIITLLDKLHPYQNS